MKGNLRRYGRFAIIIISVLAIFLLAGRMFGVGGIQLIFVIGFIIAFTAALLLSSVSHLAYLKILFIAGLVVLAGLILPSSYLVNLGFFNFPVENVLSWILIASPAAACLLAGLLIEPGLTALQQRRGQNTPSAREAAGWVSVFCFSLAAVLIIRWLFNEYWLMIWDSTDDSVYWIWIVLPIAAALAAGLVLLIRLPGRQKWAALYGLLLPALMVVIYFQAKSINPQELTAQHAIQVAQAIEDYNNRRGSYPESLTQLTPLPFLSIPAPISIHGLGWCYHGGDGYYRLGYIARDHWSSPNLYGQLVSETGQNTDLPPLCQDEIYQIKLRLNW